MRSTRGVISYQQHHSQIYMKIWIKIFIVYKKYSKLKLSKYEDKSIIELPRILRCTNTRNEDLVFIYQILIKPINKIWFNSGSNKSDFLVVNTLGNLRLNHTFSDNGQKVHLIWKSVFQYTCFISNSHITNIKGYISDYFV